MKEIIVETLQEIPALYTGKVIIKGDKFLSWKNSIYDGAILYYRNGLYHKEDGPAVIYADGRRYFYLNGYGCSGKVIFEKLDPEKKAEAIWDLDEWVKELHE